MKAMGCDWGNTRKLLVAGSIPAFTSFFVTHPVKTVRAVGFTWEWGQAQAAFYPLANTRAGIDEALTSINQYQTVPLTTAEALEKIRWDAGYFSFPAGLLGPSDELGADWAKEADKLYDVTQKMGDIDTSNAEKWALYCQTYDAFLADLVTTCCQALADMARAGLFGDDSLIDFWVGSTDDNGDAVRDRNMLIRELIG